MNSVFNGANNISLASSTGSTPKVNFVGDKYIVSGYKDDDIVTVEINRKIKDSKLENADNKIIIKRGDTELVSEAITSTSPASYGGRNSIKKSRRRRSSASNRRRRSSRRRRV